MNIFKTLLGSKLNPMIPIGRYIFKMVLGDYIMIDVCMQFNHRISILKSSFKTVSATSSLILEK